MDIKDQIKRVNAYKQLADTDFGKLILEDLSRFCYAKGSTYSGNAHDMVFNEGKRNVYLYVNSIINIDPKALEEMYKGQSEES